MADERPEFKTFPRNLTARAERVIRGNPAVSRPESGVDNCYPGLEFDQRNLEKRFLPGLHVEYHRDDGAIIRSFESKDPAWPSDKDLPLHLWAVTGRFGVSASPARLLFQGLNGLEVWRRIHDLLPGRVVALLGPTPGFGPLALTQDMLDRMQRSLADGRSATERDAAGKALWGVVAGDRARYLDAAGVIDVGAFQPGELTQTLCAPWQYDFRDCGCFYWASNKPDLVTSGDGQYPYLNYQRRDRTTLPPPADVPPAGADESTWLRRRREQELGYEELVAGAWNDLPVVLNDRESARFVPPPPPPVKQLMSPQEVIEELRYLATVEHALCVEYLYAHYSLNAPPRLPPDPVDPRARRIYAAADEVFKIAQDEMRHLRWVNEALGLLGQTSSLGRASHIGRALQRPFALAPLTPGQLQWFIEVERPSREIGVQLDGMYVMLHTSIERQPELFPEWDRLTHLIKLVIDEGGDHFQRFVSIQRHLDGLMPADYIRTLENAQAGYMSRLQDVFDQLYRAMLATLHITFAYGDKAGGVQLKGAVDVMRHMHETAHLLASGGIRTRFTLQDFPETIESPPVAYALVDGLQASLTQTLDALVTTERPELGALAARQRASNETLFAEMRRLIRASSGR